MPRRSQSPRSQSRQDRSPRRPRRVAFLTNSMAAGGAETQVRWLVQSVDPAEVRARLAWYNTSESFHLPPASIEAAPLPRRHQLDHRFALALRRLSSRKNTDLVYAWQPTPAFYAALFRQLPGSAPVISAVRHSATLFDEQPVSKLLHPLASRLGDHTTVNCRDVIPWLVERGIPQDQITYIPNVLPPPLLARTPSTPEARAALLTRLGLDPARPPVVQVARLDANKNAEALLRALLALKRDGHDVPPLLLIGRLVDPELTARLQHLAKQAGYDELHIHPPISEIPTLMEAARVVALASLSEGTPNVVLEALALARVVVATRVGEVPQMIRHGETGWLCDPGDVRDLTTQLHGALNQPVDAAQQMGNLAREATLARHAPTAVLPQLMALFDAVIARR